MRIGDIVKYHGEEWCITFLGPTYARLERGYGLSHSIIIVDYSEIG